MKFCGSSGSLKLINDLISSRRSVLVVKLFAEWKLKLDLQLLLDLSGDGADVQPVRRRLSAAADLQQPDHGDQWDAERRNPRQDEDDEVDPLREGQSLQRGEVLLKQRRRRTWFSLHTNTSVLYSVLIMLITDKTYTNYSYNAL